MPKVKKPNKLKILIAWSLYDWACSAFPVVITTFIFATYFTTHVAINPIRGTYEWANATAIAGISIAFLSPILGAIADHSGWHKRWLFVMTWLCVIFTAMLWFVYPSSHYVSFSLTCFVLATISLEVGLVFYNSFLPHLAPQKYLGRISGWAWGLGYFGGIAALSIMLFGMIKHPPSWLNVAAAEQVRIAGPLVACWFAIFSLPFFLIVPESQVEHLPFHQAIRLGFKELFGTIKFLSNKPNLFFFLLAHLIYIDGLNTLFAFGGIYAAGTFHMNISGVILFGITMNVAAGIGAITLAWVDDFLGSKPTILLSLCGLFFFGICVLLVHSVTLFWLTGLSLSLFLGPVQSASRSLMARMTPADKTTELFGLYAFSGKITAFIGPWLLGWVTLYFDSQRAGISTILLFFATGGFLMYFVTEPKKPRLSKNLQTT